MFSSSLSLDRNLYETPIEHLELRPSTPYPMEIPPSNVQRTEYVHVPWSSITDIQRMEIDHFTSPYSPSPISPELSVEISRTNSPVPGLNEETEMSHTPSSLVISSSHPLQPMTERRRICTKIKHDVHMTPEKYMQQSINLRTYKRHELQEVYTCLQIRPFNTFFRIHVPKTKQMLMEQIDRYCKQWYHAITIQRMIRGHFVRELFSPTLHGEAWKQRHLCVNETDVYTMEPLSEIPSILFFSYTTSSSSSMEFHPLTTTTKEYIYGFDVHSLILMSRKCKHTCMNPYNREKIPYHVKQQFFKLYSLIRIVFPMYIIQNDVYIPLPKPRRLPLSFTSTHQRRENNRPIQIHHQTPTNMTMIQINQNQYQLSNYQMVTLNILGRHHDQYIDHLEEMVIHILQHQTMLHEMSQQPIPIRIRNLFLHINQLGNYTDSQWFVALTERQLKQYMETLMELWHGRTDIPLLLKRRICPIIDPFFGLFQRNDHDLEYLQTLCLTTMERIVFSSFEEEFQTLGSMHVLTVLTVVSIEARQSLFWLYESIR
jgi:hypothetical protein